MTKMWREINARLSTGSRHPRRGRPLRPQAVDPKGDAPLHLAGTGRGECRRRPCRPLLVLCRRRGGVAATAGANDNSSEYDYYENQKAADIVIEAVDTVRLAADSARRAAHRGMNAAIVGMNVSL